MEQKRPLRAREWLSWPMLAIEAPASEARRRRMLLVVTEEQPSQPPGCIGRERSTEPFKDPNRGPPAAHRRQFRRTSRHAERFLEKAKQDPPSSTRGSGLVHEARCRVRTVPSLCEGRGGSPEANHEIVHAEPPHFFLEQLELAQADERVITSE